MAVTTTAAKARTAAGWNWEFSVSTRNFNFQPASALNQPQLQHTVQRNVTQPTHGIGDVAINEADYFLRIDDPEY